MKELMFLCHRIPYPPNKGDKIRSFNILRHLAARHVVHLAAFVDDPEDWQHLAALRELCGSVELVPLPRRQALLRSATGFLTGEPLGLPYYRNRELQRWCTARLTGERAVDGVFVFSSTMAQYALQARDMPRVLDLCDVDTDKWRQYALRRRWPLNWVYRREARLLEACEREYARRFDAVLLVSEVEATLFRQIAPEAAERTSALRNGVDTVFFDPELPHPMPFPAEQRALVFTGAMDYWANADAVAWFAEKVLPLIRQRCAQAHFWIVGSRPAEAVQRLARLPGVTVTGSVPDVRPYLAHAQLVVAPLRVARGVQNKVLEALSMARPVIASSAALDGLESGSTAQIPGTQRADEPQDFARAVTQLLSGETQVDGAAGRRYVSERYGWQASLAALDRWFTVEPAPAPRERVALSVGQT
jgi:sugar transferase (PEP-CTERM/EpsH1 system associated)